MAASHTTASGRKVMSTVRSAANTVPTTPCRIVVRGPKSPRTRPHSTCKQAVPAPMSRPPKHVTAALTEKTVRGEYVSMPHKPTPIDMETGMQTRYQRP